MKYAFGELVSTDTDLWLADLGGKMGYFNIANPEAINRDELCDGNIFIFRYEPDDQFATYVPIEKVEKVMDMHDELVGNLSMGVGLVEEPNDYSDGDLVEFLEDSKALLEKARTA
jgi:hypothetical protein